MDKTMEALREMMSRGMIDREEYNEEVNHYLRLHEAVHKYQERILEKKIQLESMKQAEKIVDDPRMEKLYKMIYDGIISIDEFNKRCEYIRKTAK